MDGLYYRQQGQQGARGPIGTEQLKALIISGKLGAADQVYDAPNKRWIAIAQVVGLREFLRSTHSTQPTEPQTQPTASTSTSTSTPAPAQPSAPPQPPAARPAETSSKPKKVPKWVKEARQRKDDGGDAPQPAAAETPTRRVSLLSKLMIANAAVLALVLGGAWLYSQSDGEAGSLLPRVTLISNAEPQVTYAGDIRPLIEKYCFRCHGEEKQKAGLNLATFTDRASVLRKRKMWRTAYNMLHTREMPPEGKEQPTPEERDRITAWLEVALNTYDCSGPQDPGRVTIRRLNRNEYNNTIRDLLHVDATPADDFPTDDVGYGFDNIGDVLSLPPLLMEKYIAAAEDVLGEAIVEQPNPKTPNRRYAAGNMKHSGSSRGEGSTAVMASNGAVFTQHHFPADGKYRIVVSAGADQAGDELAKMDVRLGGNSVKVFDVKPPRRKPGNFTTTVTVKKGKRKVEAAFINDFYDPKNKNPKRRDRNLHVHSVEIIGPVDAKPPTLPESHRSIFIAYPSKDLPKKDAAKRVIKSFATRAFRRPVQDNEVADFVRLFDLADRNGETYESSIKLALTGVLASPHFLFRAEPDRPTDDPNGVYPLNDYEIASRLSYFLWSSMPDDELFSLAAQGKLRDRVVLEQQVRRMIKDKKAMAFVDHFAGQWLQLRRLPEMTPDDKIFSEYDDQLRDAMLKEAKMFFASVMLEDRPITQLLDADYTFVNEQLAKHYGIDGVAGEKFQRVELADNRRGGVLTMGAVLTVTSNPTRTNPVLRGKYVLENILGTPPPPPPPDAGELEEVDRPDLTLRQRMELHRADPNCASCHRRMDPIGFGFENFDGIGRWRTNDGDAPIDPAGKLPDGSPFSGPGELKRVLASKTDDFSRCFAEKMLTYALGRGVEEEYDVCVIRDITKALEEDGYRFSTLLIEIVNSYPFLHQRNLNQDEVTE